MGGGELGVLVAGDESQSLGRSKISGDNGGGGARNNILSGDRRLGDDGWGGVNDGLGGLLENHGLGHRGGDGVVGLNGGVGLSDGEDSSDLVGGDGGVDRSGGDSGSSDVLALDFRLEDDVAAAGDVGHHRANTGFVLGDSVGQDFSGRSVGDGGVGSRVIRGSISRVSGVERSVKSLVVMDNARANGTAGRAELVIDGSRSEVGGGNVGDGGDVNDAGGNGSDGSNGSDGNDGSDRSKGGGDDRGGGGVDDDLASGGGGGNGSGGGHDGRRGGNGGGIGDGSVFRLVDGDNGGNVDRGEVGGRVELVASSIHLVDRRNNSGNGGDGLASDILGLSDLGDGATGGGGSGDGLDSTLSVGTGHESAGGEAGSEVGFGGEVSVHLADGETLGLVVAGKSVDGGGEESVRVGVTVAELSQVSLESVAVDLLGSGVVDVGNGLEVSELEHGETESEGVFLSGVVTELEVVFLQVAVHDGGLVKVLSSSDDLALLEVDGSLRGGDLIGLIDQLGGTRGLIVGDVDGGDISVESIGITSDGLVEDVREFGFGEGGVSGDAVLELSLEVVGGEFPELSDDVDGRAELGLLGRRVIEHAKSVGVLVRNSSAGGLDRSSGFGFVVVLSLSDQDLLSVGRVLEQHRLSEAGVVDLSHLLEGTIEVRCLGEVLVAQSCHL